MTEHKYDKTVVFAGNPNVGKSTLFNLLTRQKQHTGNWAGKTVKTAQGSFKYNGLTYKAIDLPGTYSIIANSKEERCARDYICFGGSDVTVIVCDATNMERNLSFVLSILEITDNAVLCINLIDEAEKRGIKIDYEKLSDILNIPVVPVCAKSKKGIEELKNEIFNCGNKSYKLKYTECIEKAISTIEIPLKKLINDEKINTRWIAIRILCNDYSLVKSANTYSGFEMTDNKELKEAIIEGALILKENNINLNEITDKIASHTIMTAEGIFFDTVKSEETIKINADKLITNKWIAYPLMLFFLFVIFYITISGANYPSEILGNLFEITEKYLMEFALSIGIYTPICEMLISGMFRITGWVISVMLPPMVIFFPLFALLEESGILPRIAFNLDGVFKKCNTCGKQSLTMCMGFGCNSVGVDGCRIIDSERERLIAIITNSLVPCNGRFPTLLAVITMFFTENSFMGAIYLSLFIMLGIFMTFIASGILSVTILKGSPSSYIMEIPPLRKPDIIKTIISSLYDRALAVLCRAVMVAAPAGIVIWIVSNIFIGGVPLINILSQILNPFGRFLGLDGVILLAFILGFPANEIVLPVMLMTYLSNTLLIDYDNLMFMKNILVNNGWTYLTSLNMLVFTLFHFPCSTTLLTVKKETDSLKWTFLAILVPFVCGVTICIINRILFFLI